MEIPIQNIYYLLCYAWNKLEEQKVVNVDATDCTNIVDLFAKVLINGCTRLLKRGFDRNYIGFSEDLKGIKGKLDFGESVKRSLIIRAMAHCDYDEFHFNVLHNQILKTTISKLIKIKDLDKDLRIQLINIYRRFFEVDEIHITNSAFNRVILHRNNYFYDFLLKICRIIFDNILIDEKTGKYAFKDFLRDKKKMASVFEHFVRNFYSKEQSIFTSTYELIDWDASVIEGSIDLLPIMRTDISLQSSERKIIIDTKYYIEALGTYWDKQSIRSPHLYQLHAYLKNIEKKGGVNQNCEGVLLYPTVQKELDEKYQIPGHKIMAKSLNLNQPWQGIYKDLMSIIAQ